HKKSIIIHVLASEMKHAAQHLTEQKPPKMENYKKEMSKAISTAITKLNAAVAAESSSKLFNVKGDPGKTGEFLGKMTTEIDSINAKFDEKIAKLRDEIKRQTPSASTAAGAHLVSDDDKRDHKH